MKFAAGLVLLAAPAFAHVMSMSSGDLTIHGALAHYELRLPLYEIPRVTNPAESLFAHIAFSSGGRQAQLLNSACRDDAIQGAYICAADYRFAAPVDSLEVECTFPSVLAPNHVHLLRVENGARRDQAVFDISFPRVTLRFRPPTPLETAFAQTGGGVLRALAGAAQILFLASLALAARSRRELILLTAMFLAGQIATATIGARAQWQPPPRFVEAAAGLTIAYLAVEILLLPNAGMRWIIVAVLGAFHGLYFDLFLRTTGFSPWYVLSGAACAEVAAIVLLSLLFTYLGKVRICATALLVAGMAWFFMRLWN